jgi:hypothetical protein
MRLQTRYILRIAETFVHHLQVMFKSREVRSTVMQVLAARMQAWRPFRVMPS